VVSSRWSFVSLLPEVQQSFSTLFQCMNLAVDTIAVLKGGAANFVHRVGSTAHLRQYGVRE
jgi:hypothetical protein